MEQLNRDPETEMERMIAVLAQRKKDLEAKVKAVAEPAENDTAYVAISREEMKKRMEKLVSKLVVATPVSTNDFNYERDCEEYCDAHGVGSIEKEIIENCFRMPTSGVKVQFSGFHILYFPACPEGELTERVKKKLGTYCENNGIVSFVYRDGHTYVAKGLGIINDLLAAGFVECNMYVPFSKGDEQIVSKFLRDKWAQVPTRHSY